MKKKEVLKLKNGDIINHKNFRKAIVKEVIITPFGDLFGVKILPLYYKDRVYLQSKSGLHFNTPFLESSVKLITINDNPGL